MREGSEEERKGGKEGGKQGEPEVGGRREPGRDAELSNSCLIENLIVPRQLKPVWHI